VVRCGHRDLPVRAFHIRPNPTARRNRRGAANRCRQWRGARASRTHRAAQDTAGGRAAKEYSSPSEQASTRGCAGTLNLRRAKTPIARVTDHGIRRSVDRARGRHPVDVRSARSCERQRHANRQRRSCAPAYDSSRRARRYAARTRRCATASVCDRAQLPSWARNGDVGAIAYGTAVTVASTSIV
jgi:hypothetical protein